jgi:hypothetical protein
MSDTSFYDERVCNERMATEHIRQRPFMMLRPKMTQIDEIWRAQYWDVSACGKTPEEASHNFDSVWNTGKIPHGG